MSRKTRAIKSLAVLFTAVAALFSFATDASAGTFAADITRYCRFSPSSNSSAFIYATDGDYITKWQSAKTTSRYIDISIPSPYQVGGMYFVWSSAPSMWELFAYESGSLTSVLEGGTEGYLTQYIYIPPDYSGYRSFRFVITPQSASSAVDLAELSIFEPGDAPYYAPVWQPFSGRADLLTIAAHPDDEDLYLSVPAVTYADQGMKCQTVLMTYGSASDSVRRYEAQESVWSLGNLSYPAMGNFLDIKKATKEQMMKYWSLNDAAGFIVEQIRKYKPSVIVTHDIGGEYGHGAHMLTEYATELAFQYAGDPASYPDSAGKYGTWKPGKLYVHLYGGNALNMMSLTDSLSTFGNRTVLKVIEDAYSRQKSQLPGRSLPTSGAYDMRKFGLCATNLGNDRTHRSMFENVSDDAMLALNPWYNYEIVDRSALQQALDTAKEMSEANYTPESWGSAGLSAAIVSAQRIMDNRESTQSQVDGQTSLLGSAMDKLVSYLTDMQIADPPERQGYIVGEALDLKGLIVTALYKDGSKKTVPVTEDNISGFDSSSPARGQEVTVKYADAYAEKTASFCVDIIPPDGEKIASAVYTVDRANWLLTGISIGTTAGQLTANLSNDAASVKLFNKDGGECTDDPVATGMTMKLMKDGIVEDELKLSVLGDVSGDGIIDINDILYIRADIVDTYTLKSYQIPAAELNRDGVIDVTDILYIRAHILGTYVIRGK